MSLWQNVLLETNAVAGNTTEVVFPDVYLSVKTFCYCDRVATMQDTVAKIEG